MKVRAIIQARMSSSRLRGKTLMPVSGTTLLRRVVETTRKHSFLNEVVVATSDLPEDDPIEAYCKYIGIPCIRGSKLNLFSRFELASQDLDEKDQLIRITADNPFAHISASLKLFDEHINENLDYSCVEGLSHIVCEIIKVSALRSVSREQSSLNEYDKEHVTPIFRKKESNFKIQMVSPESLELSPALDRLLTVDTKDDLHRIEKMIDELSLDHDELIDFKKMYTWLERNSVEALTINDAK